MKTRITHILWLMTVIAAISSCKKAQEPEPKPTPEKESISLNLKTASVDYSGGILNISGKSNVNIQVEIPTSCDWVSITKAASEFTFSFTVSGNGTEDERSVDVIFKGKESKEIFTITQSGAPWILFKEEPGIYKEKVKMLGPERFISQTGTVTKADGTCEYHILNVSDRKYCLFQGFDKSSVIVGQNISMTIRQNFTDLIPSSDTHVITILKCENDRIWGIDNNTNIGIIL